MPRLDLDEEVEENLLNVVQGDGSSKTNQRIDREQKSLLLVRLRNENDHPDVDSKVQEPGWNVLRP